MNSQIPILVVDTNSWHFQYFQKIRKYFGLNTSSNKATSLCPYVQTMIWGSIIFALTLPFQIIGWFTIKCTRCLYRFCELHQFTTIVDLIDKTPLGVELDAVEHNLKSYPLITTVVWSLALILGLFGIGVITFAVGTIVYLLCTNITAIPYFLLRVITNIGWFIVCVASYVSYAVIQIFTWLMIALNAVIGFLCSPLTWYYSGTIIVGLLVLTLVSFIIAWISMQIGNSKSFQGICTWLTMKLNGYAEAKQLANARRAEELKATSDKEEETAVRSNWLQRQFITILNIFGSTYVKNEDKLYKVLSFGGIIIAFAKAIKHKACPIVKFADSSQLTNDADN